MATIAAAILPGRRMSHGTLLLGEREIGCSMCLPLSALGARFIPGGLPDASGAIAPRAIARGPSHIRLKLAAFDHTHQLHRFGAMPMCHGAGGLQAQYRFGARTGLAPIILGVVVLVLAVGFADHAAGLLAIIPTGAVGALLILAGTDLAVSRRLFDGKPSCWWVIGVTAVITATVNPALGLIFGWITELIRAAIVRRQIPGRPKA